ncbi:MAG: GTPase domain-containing protein [Planctomycetes bacterium]|nr:GTPase domain-containing protein [Planctomycetota bacterium]
MDVADQRTVISQLAEDLSWLEDHCRRQPDLAKQAGQLRLAAGLVRNVVGPFVNGQAPTPLHIAVVGGAGAGKSSIVNFLTGAIVAEANPQAGYTRHPTAYIPSTGLSAWPAHAGYLGPLQRLDLPSPANLDEDVYQVHTVGTATPGEAGFGPLGDCVIWDCPDMTTWAATGYVPRLMEIASLADVIVFVASDERYNDAVPTQFLHLLIQAGKPVVVCLTKMREATIEPMTEHFQATVLGSLPKTSQGKSTVPVVAIPFLNREQLADPVKNAAKYRIPLLNQVLAMSDPPAMARKRSVTNALRYLTTAGEGLLEFARQDLAALDGWRNLVRTGQVEFNNRYRREFLNGERFRRFDDTREQLMDQLELPGAGRLVGVVLWGIRTPYRLIRGFMGKALSRPDSVNLPENSVLEGSLRAWLDSLRAESLRRADSHPLWRHVVNGFSGGLGESANDRFKNDLLRFQMTSADEIESVCRSMTNGLEENPSLLASLRVGKLLLDGAAIGLGIWAGGLAWPSLIFVPLFASATHQVVEIVVWQMVDHKRSQIRSRKEKLVNQTIAEPLADWLAEWPATGGSAYERLQLTLRRIPEGIAILAKSTDNLLQAPLA